MEYKGYGIYNGEISAEQIKHDSLRVYNHMCEKIYIQEKNIFLFGRSIGTGPACFLGSKRQPGGIILMSAYTSIKNQSNNCL
ncbi:hypothetical protein IMG5_144450 [Ichthyophthirius multifiliis]|uniref:Uncharacterized protein n=1 Tax=Ichthyophthirius multifiliis TaxID=5932 RepID=G0QXP3_ICHMU|nr:hypothetical protein IMG5_144450 [Ichthyophthirius multifiliis]EGR30012.1 hypothetical protein IMG5_144450 [Ichthyophthirius multifiliis]|eukprot:XP_004031248.1 hypothetical protein IMG5_144450 [Ichthyophthirius multifiliis]